MIQPNLQHPTDHGRKAAHPGALAVSARPDGRATSFGASRMHTDRQNSGSTMDLIGAHELHRFQDDLIDEWEREFELMVAELPADASDDDKRIGGNDDQGPQIGALHAERPARG